MALHNQPQEQCPALSRSLIAIPRKVQPSQLPAQEPTPHTNKREAQGPCKCAQPQAHSPPLQHTSRPGPEMEQGVDCRDQCPSAQSSFRVLPKASQELLRTPNAYSATVSLLGVSDIPRCSLHAGTAQGLSTHFLCSSQLQWKSCSVKKEAEGQNCSYLPEATQVVGEGSSRI